MRGLAGAAYRLLLRLYPRAFRASEGQEMVDGFHRRLLRARERGLARSLGVAAVELLDLLVNVVPAHLDQWRARPGSRARMSLRGRALRGPVAGVLEDAWQDLRLGLRSVARRPGFAAVVVATLGLAVGASTTVFAVLDGALLEPLPYPDVDELVFMAESQDGQYRSVSWPNYLDWRERNRAFEELGARAGWSFTLSGEGPAEVLPTLLVTPSLLDILDVEPERGRVFTGDEVERRERVVLISGDLWRRRFGADPAVVGRSIALDEEPWTVVGVLPASLEFPLQDTDVFAPFSVLSADDLNRRTSHPGISVVGRMDDGVTYETAQRRNEELARALEADYPEANTGYGIIMASLTDFHLGDSPTVLILLLGAVSAVLLIACANVASLFLTRGTERRAEAAVRTALGSGRGRLVRAMVSEGLVLALLGGGIGVMLAFQGVALVRRFQPGGLPRLGRAEVDGSVLLFALAAVLVSVAAAALLPALRASDAAPAAALRTGGRSGDDVRVGRLRRILVVAEVALSVVLLLGAGLMIRSVEELLAVDPGLDTENVLAVHVPISTSRYPTDADRWLFYERLTERVGALPGVRSVAGVDPLPLSGFNRQWTLSGENLPTVGEEGLRTDLYRVTPGYFATMGVPIIEGRGFDGDETADAPRVVVDESLARRLWPGESAVGRLLRFRGAHGPWMEVVGVAGHVRHYGAREEGRGQIYTPASVGVWSLSLVVETEGAPRALLPSIRRVVGEMDPSVALVRIHTMEELHRRSAADERVAGMGLQALAAGALLLALLGLYGLMTYAVTLRRREIGIRLALGAQRTGVVRAATREGAMLGALGVLLGLALAVVGSRLLQGLLYGVAPTDPTTYGVVAGLALGVTTLAAAVPAARATRVDPSEVLRAD